MAFEREQRAALRILEGIEEGTMSSGESFTLIDEADPALVFLIFTWIRNRYAEHVNSDAVIGRLVAVSDGYPSVKEKMKEGQADPVVEWFEDAYSYKSLGSKAFIALIVEKLEG